MKNSKKFLFIIIVFILLSVFLQYIVLPFFSPICTQMYIFCEAPYVHEPVCRQSCVTVEEKNEILRNEFITKNLSLYGVAAIASFGIYKMFFGLKKKL